MEKTLSKKWKSLIKDENINIIKSFLDKEYQIKNIFPLEKNIFKALSYFEPDETRVIIIGQDPYHTPECATGLSFSVPTGMKLPPSLKNIYKEIESDLGVRKDFNNGNLEPWAQQGVLLLNSILSVEAHKPGSHRKRGWENITDDIIKNISQTNNNLVFILWGNFAKTKKQLIDGDKHLILESNHPSPFSAYRGFFGNKHFSQTNEYLKKHNKKTIIW